MANRNIFTRAYSKKSAARLISAKGPKGTLSHIELLEEFRNHANKRNREATALVSVSDRIIDTVKRAFDKHYIDGEPPGDIWIAFIEVQAMEHEEPARFHAAHLLAEECELPEPDLFYHEIVFEWAVSEKFVLHRVSLQTLMGRGLDREKYFAGTDRELRCLSTAELRCNIARDIQPSGPWIDAWEIGIYLASFSRNFGARAPLNWIAYQLFYDCVWTKTFVEKEMVRLRFAHGYFEIVDFEFFSSLDDGIDIALCEWWLADIDFLLGYKEFETWRDVMEEGMIWGLIEFWEAWHDVDDDDTDKETSWDELCTKNDDIKAAIEAEAVAMGL